VQTALFQAIDQGLGDVILADHFGEILRPVFARENLVLHRISV